jgi:hypothetical protein
VLCGSDVKPQKLELNTLRIFDIYWSIGFCLFSSHVIWVKRVVGKTLQKTNHQMNECLTSIYICNPFGIKLETNRALQTENTRT